MRRSKIQREDQCFFSQMRSDKIEIRRLKIVMGNCKAPQAFGFSVLYNLTRLHWRWLQPCMSRPPCSAFWRCYQRRAEQKEQVIWWSQLLLAVSNKREAQNVAVGEQLGRHLQPAASDHFSLRGTAVAAHERYMWWEDGARHGLSVSHCVCALACLTGQPELPFGFPSLLKGCTNFAATTCCGWWVPMVGRVFTVPWHWDRPCMTVTSWWRSRSCE